MAFIKLDGGFNALPISYKRGNPIPLDTTAVWYDFAELENYAKTGATAYVGQILTHVDSENATASAYLISSEGGALVKLAATTTSGDLAQDVITLQGQVADLIAAVGTAAEGSTAATGLYKEIADVLEALNAHKSAEEAHSPSQVGLGNVTNDAQVKRSEMGVANGVATLGEDGKVPAAQLPSFVDDVLEFASKENFPANGESGKIYVALDTGKTYRWGGTEYVVISDSIALGETAGTAYEGSKGKANADAIAALQANVVMKNGTDRLMTEAEGTKLAGIEAGAQVNVIDNVSGEFEIGDNKTLQIKEIAASKVTGLDAAVTSKVDKDTDAVANDIAIFVEGGNIVDSGKKLSDLASSAQGAKADSAIQGVNVNGTALTANDAKIVNIKIAQSETAGNIKVNDENVAITGFNDKANIGTSSDAETADTIYGAKAFATKAVADHNTIKAVADVEGTAGHDGHMTASQATKLAGIEEGAQANIIESVKVNGSALSVTEKSVNITIPKNVEDGAEVNIIETVKVNGSALIPDAQKAVNITVPTTTNDLTNNSGFLTADDLTDDFNAKADKANTYTKGEVDAAVKGEADRAKLVEQGLRTDVDSKLASLTAGNASIKITGTNTAPIISTGISASADNALILAEDGLKVVVPVAAEYSLKKDANPSGDAYVATYRLTKDGVNVGEAINIPKDFVIKSASLNTSTGDNLPQEGFKAGDKYIDFVVNTADGTGETHIYLNVHDLVDVYTGKTSDSIEVTVEGTVVGAKLTETVKADIAKGVSADTKVDELRNEVGTAPSTWASSDTIYSVVSALCSNNGYVAGKLGNIETYLGEHGASLSTDISNAINSALEWGEF